MSVEEARKTRAQNEKLHAVRQTDVIFPAAKPDCQLLFRRVLILQGRLELRLRCEGARWAASRFLRPKNACHRARSVISLELAIPCASRNEIRFIGLPDFREIFPKQ